jgi:hypothetical protein
MMRALAAALASLAMLAMLGCAADGRAQGPAEVFFDDFSYATPEQLPEGGWQVRTAGGHPGLPGGRFGLDALAIVDDPGRAGNRLLRMTARTDGTGAGTAQAQLCHQRKYLEGTYAARVRFTDAPVQGADGDPVIETFYAVSPLAHAFDPDFSEVDWEYLPNGGWGSEKTRLYAISWQTVQVEPWEAHNSAHEEFGSFAGWHVLLMQVAHGEVHAFVDGRPVAVHGGRNVPVRPMAIAFNLWFSTGGLRPASTAPRVWEEDVDWVFHARNAVLSPSEVDAAVQALRAAHTVRSDGVPAADPPLEARCDF